MRIITQLPNVITWSRVACIPLILFGTLTDSAWIAQWSILYGVVSDKLDGTLARLLSAESEFGKKIESVADPLFSIAGGIYVVLRTDFPSWLFWFGIGLFALNTLPRAYLLLSGRGFFFQKSEITRISTALLFITMVFYVWALPFREWLAYTTALWGCVTTLNYLRMQYRHYTTTAAS